MCGCKLGKLSLSNTKNAKTHITGREQHPFVNSASDHEVEVKNDTECSTIQTGIMRPSLYMSRTTQNEQEPKSGSTTFSNTFSNPSSGGVVPIIEIMEGLEQMNINLKTNQDLAEPTKLGNVSGQELESSISKKDELPTTKTTKKDIIPILYTQSGLGTEAVLSQIFPDLVNLYTEAADDFVVPDGQTWILQQLLIPGAYSPGVVADPTGINVAIYSNDTVGLPHRPGNLIYSFKVDPPNFVDLPRGTYTITLPPNIILSGGTYWLSVQPYLDISFNSTTNLWVWRRFPGPTINTVAMYRSNFITNCGTNEFGPITTCYFGEPNAEPNLIFTIYGQTGLTPCVHPDTLVNCILDMKTHSRGWKPIKEIKAGDIVIDRLFREVKVKYNIKFTNKSRDFIKIPRKALPRHLLPQDLLIRKGHPVWYDGKEMDCSDLANYLGNKEIKEIDIETPVNVYSLCTKERTFVIMNGLPVCTWGHRDWQRRSKNNKRILWNAL